MEVWGDPKLKPLSFAEILGRPNGWKGLWILKQRLPFLCCAHLEKQASDHSAEIGVQTAPEPSLTIAPALDIEEEWVFTGPNSGFSATLKFLLGPHSALLFLTLAMAYTRFLPNRRCIPST